MTNDAYPEGFFVHSPDGAYYSVGWSAERAVSELRQISRACRKHGTPEALILASEAEEYLGAMPENRQDQNLNRFKK